MFKRIFLSFAFVATFAIAATFNSTASAHGGGYYSHGHHQHHGHGGYGYSSYYRPYMVGSPIIRGSYYPAQFYGGYYAPYYDPYYYGPPRSGVIIGW